VGLAGFMYGGSAGDVIAITMATAALWRERETAAIPQRRSLGAVLLATILYVVARRVIVVLQPTMESISLFENAGFHKAFFSHFGPLDFMGVSLHGSWWVVVYYAAVMVILNVGGEELWWRGYVLPRQERYFRGWTWLVHGMCWSLFHLFLQPTAWDTLRMAITGCALAFVALRTRSTWPGVIGHVSGNLPFLLSLVHGV
jgi:membrane protease YdiL (CAAX protease family)